MVRVQKSIIRVILIGNYRTSCCPNVKLLNIVSLSSMYIFKLLVFVHGKCFVQFRTQHSHSTQNLRLLGSQSIASHFLKNPQYMGTQI